MSRSDQLLTTRQLLADLSADYDLDKIMLKPHEVLEGVTVTESAIVVTTTKFRTRETRSELQFTHRGTQMRHWKLVNSHWVEQRPMIVWDDDYTPAVVPLFGRRTESERRDSAYWAALCNRPGNNRQPMLSWERVAYDDPRLMPPKMKSHWSVVDHYMTETQEV